MNGGTEKKLGRKTWRKKNTGTVRNTAKLHMYRRHNFKKEIRILKTDHERSREQDFP